VRWPGFDLRSDHVGFVVDKVALGHVFSEYFSLPYYFSFPRMLYTDVSSGAGTIDQSVADVPSGLKFHTTLRNKNIMYLNCDCNVHGGHSLNV
jgi:hypothetical protein